MPGGGRPPSGPGPTGPGPQANDRPNPPIPYPLNPLQRDSRR
jgi:hypothetical protein